MKSSRRLFLKNSFVASSAIGVSSAATAFNAIFEPNTENAKKKLKLFTFIPDEFPLWGNALAHFAQEVYHETNGEVAISVYDLYEAQPGNVRPEKILDFLQSDEYDMCHFSPGTLFEMNPVYALFGYIPSGLNGIQLNRWIVDAYKNGLTDKYFQEIGIKAFPFGTFGSTGFWANAKIHQLTDLNRLKIRCLHLSQQVLERVGGQPSFSDFTQLRSKLVRGEIDGFEGISPYIDCERGYHELELSYYTGPWPKHAYAMGLMLKLSSWQSLGQKYQGIFEKILLKNHHRLTEAARRLDDQALSTLNSNHLLRELPQDVSEALGDEAQNIMAEYSRQSQSFKEAFDKYLEYRL